MKKQPSRRFMLFKQRYLMQGTALSQPERQRRLLAEYRLEKRISDLPAPLRMRCRLHFYRRQILAAVRAAPAAVTCASEGGPNVPSSGRPPETRWLSCRHCGTSSHYRAAGETGRKWHCTLCGTQFETIRKRKE